MPKSMVAQPIQRGLRRGRMPRWCAIAVGLALSGLACQVNVPAPPTGRTVSFANDIQPIFDANCTICHVTGGLADLEGIALRLTAADAFNLLINQPSSQDAGLTLVVPGDSTSSLLFQKVSSDSPPVGSRMPLFGAPLSSADLGLIRDWIDQGAMNN